MPELNAINNFMEQMAPDLEVLWGLYYDDTTGAWHRESMTGDPEHPEELGIELAKIMKGRYESTTHHLGGRLEEGACD